MSDEARVLDVWINCPNHEVARTIGDALLAARLVACANLFPPIESAYHWKGAIERDEEVPLLVKTRPALFDAVVERVTALHPYETPGVVGAPIQHVNEAYARWVIEETGGPDGSGPSTEG